jgi:hypothetical protein
MKKLMAILLVVVMIGLPLNLAYGKGGGKPGGGKAGGGKAKAGAAKKSTKKAMLKKWAGLKQQKRDKAEDKDTCKNINRR